ncbi:hypothetical protein ACVN8H_24605, partial [Escherichia coli]
GGIVAEKRHRSTTSINYKEMIDKNNHNKDIDRFNRSTNTNLKLLRSAKKNKNIPRHDHFSYSDGVLLNKSNFC